jgi:DNA-binding GntR family transcriptional regulator
MVAQRLRDMVQSGELAPGTVLRQTEIAERFGVSTTPVREAFAVLMREGVVQQVAHRSVMVFQPRADEVAEIYEIRGALEPLATELAARNISVDQVAELEAIVTEMSTAPPPRYIELNGVLHDTIYDIAARPRLADMLKQLRKTSASYVKLTITRDGDEDPDYRKAVHQQHEEIVAALKAGKGKLAARIVRAHLKTSADHIAKLVANGPES